MRTFDCPLVLARMDFFLTRYPLSPEASISGYEQADKRADDLLCSNSSHWFQALSNFHQGLHVMSCHVMRYPATLPSSYDFEIMANLTKLDRMTARYLYHSLLRFENN